MKLTKKLEAEILKAYTEIWDAYLRGDMRTFASILDENCYIIGSAAGEVFSNKRAAVKYYKSTAEQITGKAEFRNRKIKVMPVEKGFMVNEESDFYLLIDDQWTFYGPARISSLFHKKNSKWKVIHQHGSFPDSKTEEGEQVNTDKIKAENIQLRDAVKRRTEELENKNRELEIETALERVRAVAMAMRKPEDLSGIGDILFTELKSLGFADLRNTEIIIISDVKETLTSYYYSDYGVTGIVEVDYKSDPKVQSWVDQLKKANDAFAEIVITEKEIKAWRRYREEVGHLPDPKLNKAKAVYYYSYSIGMGGLSISTFKPASKEHIEILERFRNVFNLSYQRYIDIAKAEAQVREAQIETGLERVRSKTMAMHKSEEVTGIAVSLNEELMKLGFEGGSTIIIIDKETGDTEQWTGFSEDKTLKSCYVPHFKHPYHDAQLDAWKRGDRFLVYTLTGDEKKTVDEHYFATGYKDFPESDKKWMRQMRSVTFSHAFMKYGSIHWGPGHLTEEQLEILQRFSKVFEQSYTRFLDLQKAEAQAKEAQIEAALERVRSRSMAMHKTDDLHEVIKVVTEQLSVLGLKFNVTNFAKINSNGSWDLWLSTPEQAYPALIYVPYLDHPIFNRITEEEAKGNDFYTDVYTWEETNIFFHHFFENTIARNSPEERKQFVYGSKGLARSVFQTKNIWFSVARYDITAFTDEENAIFKRFANVFEQAYTRFLDLQKAETQARETEIELSLERVRAKTMAMQKPSEFVDVINIIGEQFVHLDFDIEWVNFGANGLEISKGIDIWNFAVIPGSPPISARVFIPYFDHPLFNSAVEELDKYSRTGNDFFIMTLTKDDKDRWLDHLFTKTIFKDVPEEYRTVQYAKPGYTTSNIALKNTWFSIGKFDPRSFTDEQHSILRRFAKAFGQAYTRFLDLQKAEAQAREAQIEAGLERVRSRAMAMQNSEELKQLIGTVFTELTKLDIVLTRCLIMIYDPTSNDSIWWMANSEAPTQPIGLRIQNHQNPPYVAYLKAWQEKKLKWVYVLEGAVKKDWDNFLFVETELSHLPDFVITGMKAPERVYLNSSFNSFGNLTLASLEALSNEHFDILLRFAKVFDLTYTRFNDLQKAEAQTREAQIELALERVRARTMAMHKSEELAETAQVLFQQLSELGGIPDRISIGIADEVNSVVDFWSTDQQGSHLDHSFSARLNERTTIAKTYQAWKEQKKFLVIDLQGEELKEWIQFAREEMGIAVKDDQIKDRRVHSLAFFSHGWILVTSHKPQSIETIQILERFASVFNLTYRRFLDLQKAEAQANEARIEIALERIRARALAMHKSDELTEVAKVLREQMALLGQPELEASVIHLYEEDPDYILSWRAFRPSEAHNKIAYGHMSILKNSCEFVREWLTKFYSEEKEYTIELSGAKQEEWYDLFFKLAPDVVNSMRQENSIHEKRYYRFSKFSGGALLMVSKQEPSEEVTYLQRRAAVVFDLAYRRFSDLQKAEAQAREAQIEMALEKVRSRSLAMHKSDELQEVVNTVFERLQDLNIEMASANIAIFKEGTRNYDYWIASPVQKRSASFHMPYTDLSLTRDLIAARESGKEFSTTAYSFEEKNEWFEYAFKNTDFKFLNEERKQFILNAPAITVAIAFSKNTGVQVNRYTSKLYTEREGEILKRFSKVFEQAYIRFLDLEKAEAQVREAQIEASLERVRSKTMAMHNSQDVGETVATMFDELVQLGIETLRCGIGVMHEEYRMEVWTAKQSANKKSELVVGQMDMRMHALTKGVYHGWRDKEESYSYDLKDDDLIEYFTTLNSSSEYPMRYEIGSLPSRQFHNSFYFPEGVLYVFTLEQLSVEAAQIFKRFTAVFGQTYRRYLDLQKAEANAREAKVEAALERVRAKAMAMHSSKDLAETLSVFYRELKSLSVTPIRCGVALMDRETRMAELTTMNTTGEGDSIEIIGKIKMTGHRVLDNVFESWLTQKEYHAVLRGNQIKEYYQVLKPQIDYLDYSHDEVQFGYYFMFNEGDVYAWTEKELTEDELTIYRRFTTVISLTYKRYKDLQQAEAQAREAKIEAGLERVRARTMAMHSSEDVSIATATMFTELEKLEIQNLRGGITIIKPGDKQEVWGVTNLPDGRTIRSIGEFDMHLHPLWRGLLKAKLNKGDYNYYHLTGKDKENYIDILNATPNYLSQPIKEFPDVHVQSYFFGEGAIWTNSLEPHSEEQKQTMKRFASVFSLTFRRFQDLQKAETQAREATIEAALERVRGKAMAMHSSKDLATTIGVFYHELEGLNLTPRRCGVGLINKETMIAEISTMNASADGEGIEMVGNLDLRSHPVLTGVYNNWLTKTEYHPVLRGNEIKEYYQVVRPQIDFPDYPNDTVQYGYFFFFEEGGVYAWTEKELNEEELKIYRRFTSVLSLTYKRYKDLKDAEARTQAAIKDAALDRIRADIASMRTITDLDRITPLIWNELTILGIPFIRCGVFIMDDAQQLIHTFLSTPDGKAIAAFHLPYDTPGNLNNVVANWKENRNYIDHWDETEFIQFADILVKEGALVSSEQYLKTIPKGGFYLHFLPFLQGMLYVGNTDQLKEEEIELIQHVADAFSTAYARYEDFNKLEAAKQQVEKTLTDLKQAQTQLVQSEKMASLGEMTAGIAHEIQNPLNFVNNFSEVSKELLDEMKTELETGNTEDAKNIADDVIRNLEKINHHGKRADAIVKSMLQHSRSGSGKKEPADINGLADEYLRLAYHGLRAKDKSFNAKFETEFDNNIGKINIISQDIGRVLVNLINNAFYAVTERKKQESNASPDDPRLNDSIGQAVGRGYEPTVTVCTKKIDDKIEIKVKDNGNGIPQKALDKIFQPFFTTKPTGQGTGLGLSLAYDIVTKGHGGELKVETKEGEGSQFIIQLPVSKTPES